MGSAASKVRLAEKSGWSPTMKIDKLSPKLQSGKLTISKKYKSAGQKFNFNGTKISIDIEDPSINRILETLISELGSIEVRVKVLERASKNPFIKLVTPYKEIIKEALRKLGLPQDAARLLELMAKNGKILTRALWEKFSSLRMQFPHLSEELFFEALQKKIPLKKPLLEAFYYTKHPEERHEILKQMGIDRFADPGMFYERRIYQGDPLLKNSFKARFFKNAPLIDSYHLESTEGVRKILITSRGKTVESSFTQDTAYFEMELRNSGRCRVLVTRTRIKIWFGSKVFEVWRREIEGIDLAGRKIEVHLE